MKVRRIDFSPDEWIAGCVGLTIAERGLYITACALIYSHGDRISIDHLRSACIDHGHTFNRTLDRLVELGKLTRNGDQIGQKRCENELQNAAIRSAKAQQSASKRWNNNAVDDEPHMRPSNPRAPVPSTINHQPSKKERPKPETSESPSRSPPGSPAAGRKYAFEGQVIRLSQADFDRWKASFSAIPDLIAELQVIDDKFAENGVLRREAFAKASGWLRAKHERLKAAEPLDWREQADLEAATWRARLSEKWRADLWGDRGDAERRLAMLEAGT